MQYGRLISRMAGEVGSQLHNSRGNGHMPLFRQRGDTPHEHLLLVGNVADENAALYCVHMRDGVCRTQPKADQRDCPVWRQIALAPRAGQGGQLMGIRHSSSNRINSTAVHYI